MFKINHSSYFSFSIYILFFSFLFRFFRCERVLPMFYGNGDGGLSFSFFVFFYVFFSSIDSKSNEGSNEEFRGRSNECSDSSIIELKLEFLFFSFCSNSQFFFTNQQQSLFASSNCSRSRSFFSLTMRDPVTIASHDTSAKVSGHTVSV